LEEINLGGGVQNWSSSWFSPEAIRNFIPRGGIPWEDEDQWPHVKEMVQSKIE